MLDGRLDDTERGSLVDHLAECGLCFAVFSSTSQTLAGDQTPAVRPVRSRGLRWVAAGLAGLALATLGLLHFRDRRQPADAAPAASTLAPAFAGAQSDRGHGARNAIDLDAVHPGAIELHLELALIEGRRAAAADLAGRLAERARGAEADDDTVRLLARLSQELSTERPSSLSIPDALIAETFGRRPTEEARCGEAARIAWQANAADWFVAPLGLACRGVLVATSDEATRAGIDRAWPQSGPPTEELPRWLNRVVGRGAL